MSDKVAKAERVTLALMVRMEFQTYLPKFVAAYFAELDGESDDGGICDRMQISLGEYINVEYAIGNECGVFGGIMKEAGEVHKLAGSNHFSFHMEHIDRIGQRTYKEWKALANSWEATFPEFGTQTFATFRKSTEAEKLEAKLKQN